MNLREDKGWTYGAYSGPSAPRFRGDRAASTEIEGDVTEQALNEIMNELNRLRTCASYFGPATIVRCACAPFVV